jgi:quercetin dioxygenase-like cupin family protein
VIPAGQDRLGESHSRGYSTILFKVLPSETNGGVFVIEHANLVRGGPPFHFPLYQEEYFYVIEGEVMFQIGSNRRKLVAGESVLAPRRIPHAFSSIGVKAGKMQIAFTPAGKWNNSSETLRCQIRLSGMRHTSANIIWNLWGPRRVQAKAAMDLICN